ERLTTAIARGYLDHVGEEHRARESEMYGLAAIVSAMSRSLDLLETAEVALVEALAALRLSTGAMWLRERSAYKLAHTVGLDPDQVDDFARQAGPHVKAWASALGRSESQVDRVSGKEWNALRAVAQQLLRVVRASDLCARVGGDEFAVAMPETDIDRARDVATRLRRAVDHAALGMRAPEHVEVSVGIAAWAAGEDWEAVYQ